MAYSTIHIRALVDAVRRTGVDVTDCLSTLGLPSDLVEGHSGVDGAHFERLLNLCLRESRDAHLGLHMGAQASLIGLGLSEAPTPSRTIDLRTALETFIDRYPLSVDSEAPLLRVEHGEATLCIPVHGESLGTQRLRAEYGIALSLLLLRAWAGPFVTPALVSFPFEAPEDTSDYVRMFGSEVAFGAPEAAISFSAELLRVSSYPWGRQLMRPSATHFAVPAARSSAGERVYKFLASQPTSERPGMPEIAAHLGITERTLRRRLAAEGVRFRDLLDEAQRERALSLALGLDYSPETSSTALGFSELSAYYRAFKRWTGFTPVQYRTMHLRDNAV